MEFEYYGESLDTTPDFLFMKKHYSESQDFEQIELENSINQLEEQDIDRIFADPRIFYVEENQDFNVVNKSYN